MSTEQEALAAWRADIEERAAGRAQAIKRGAVRSQQRTAPGAWRCENRWQHDDQMDIWQCVDEVELDARAARGDDQDDEDAESEQD